MLENLIQMLQLDNWYDGDEYIQIKQKVNTLLPKSLSDIKR